jgi:ribosomal protein S18 acetylase RimI-like enzyme
MQIEIPIKKGSVILREATEEDNSGIYELSLIASSDETIPAMFRNAGDTLIGDIALHDVNNRTLIAVAGQEIVGILLIDLSPPEFVDVLSLYIRNDYRRSGLASKLVGAIGKFTGSQKPIRATAITDAGMKFWQKNGYRVLSWRMEKAK